MVDELVYLIGLILVLLIILQKALTDGKKRKRQLEAALQENYGKPNTRKWQSKDLEIISWYTERNLKNHAVDFLTWQDLDMDEVYCQMAYTSSSVGDDYLYYLLHHPARSEEELKDLEEIISYYQTGEEARIGLQMLFREMGRLKNYSLSQYMDFMQDMVPGKNIGHHLVNVLLLLSLLITTVYTGIGLVLLFGLLCFNFISYFRHRAEMEPCLTSFRYILTLLDYSAKIERQLNPAWKEMKESLREKNKSFEGFRKNAFLVVSRGNMAGQGMEVILDYLRMCFHPDIIKFNSMLKQLQQHMDELWEIYALLGKLDSCLAIGEYRTYLSFYCIPRFQDEKEIILEKAYHPLVEKAVPNSLDMKQNILLTGSNASGKSTFLKTMGINILLAMTIHTCTAERLQLPFCRLFTAISLKDSLRLKESYYMAEIRAIKRILDFGKEEEQVVCMVDEVLRGTNTMERIAAATQILKEISSEGILCIAATHDEELTRTLEKEYENYHFEEELVEGDVRFSYQLKKGRVSSSNAIRLLEEFGFSRQITEGARKMIDDYKRQGEWR